MQAYKLKGKIDSAGNLVLTEPLNMPPGDVEVIVLQAVDSVASSTAPESEPQATKPKRKVECPIPIFQEWFENTEPAPPDFDPDEARWEALKEKHNL
jgi:hypothetical protein